MTNHVESVQTRVQWEAPSWTVHIAPGSPHVVFVTVCGPWYTYCTSVGWAVTTINLCVSLVKCAWNTPAFFAEKLHRAMEVCAFTLVHVKNVWIRMWKRYLHDLKLCFFLTASRHMWGHPDPSAGEPLWGGPEEDRGRIQGHVRHNPAGGHPGNRNIENVLLLRVYYVMEHITRYIGWLDVCLFLHRRTPRITLRTSCLDCVDPTEVKSSVTSLLHQEPPKSQI